MRPLILSLALLVAAPAAADGPDIKAIVDTHILPRYDRLASETAALATVARETCAPEDPTLRAAYHDAFDAWVAVSHLRFGPSEAEDRAFALAFWPDPRGSTPKALAALIRDEDGSVADEDAFATASIAARGFYALEFLLYDPQFAETENATYLCALIQAVTTDIAGNAAAISEEWQNGYAALIASQGNDTYRTEAEAAQQLFTALLAGLEFTANTRLGRPLGTFDRPRPNRAEARRSGRSLRHVQVSLGSTQDLAAQISGGYDAADRAFDAAIARAAALEDPVFAGVSTPLDRIRVEALQQDINKIREILAQDVGPSLGIAAGFNSMDGD